MGQGERIQGQKLDPTLGDSGDFSARAAIGQPNITDRGVCFSIWCIVEGRTLTWGFRKGSLGSSVHEKLSEDS